MWQAESVWTGGESDTAQEGMREAPHDKNESSDLSCFVFFVFCV